jgi:hypothetical protein
VDRSVTRGKRMGRVHYWVCRSILLLDRIPRYGRTYHYASPLTCEEDLSNSMVKEWHYMRRGMWGFYLLDRFNWLDLFLMESEYRHAVKESQL